VKRTYKFLLMLYPRAHRDQFSEEMLSVFEGAAAGRRAQGWAWYMRFAFAEVQGLIAGAAGAWFVGRTVPAPAASAVGRNALPPDVMRAQQRLDVNLAGMLQAIANRQFEKARRHSDEERRARESLRVLREKHGING
jgi:hypothetical protein